MYIQLSILISSRLTSTERASSSLLL